MGATFKHLLSTAIIVEPTVKNLLAFKGYIFSASHKAFNLFILLKLI